MVNREDVFITSKLWYAYKVAYLNSNSYELCAMVICDNPCVFM